MKVLSAALAVTFCTLADVTASHRISEGWAGVFEVLAGCRVASMDLEAGVPDGRGTVCVAACGGVCSDGTAVLRGQRICGARHCGQKAAGAPRRLVPFHRFEGYLLGG